MDDTPEQWLPGMDSNHMVDGFWICCSLLISRVTEVVKSVKSRHLVQNRHIGIFVEERTAFAAADRKSGGVSAALHV
jgi:hypothetical protein